jgi:hypothetical protein
MANRIKFYADTDSEKNKLFSFNVNDRKDALGALRRFKKSGLKIRAAWYVNTNQNVNEKLEL